MSALLTKSPGPFSVKWESPAPRMREVVLALRAIWDAWQNGTRLNFKGQFYRFDLMTPFFDPGPIEHPRIPVYIAGVNRHMCRVAGEVCDGLHVHPFNSPTYLREYVQPAVDAGLKAAGKRREAISATHSFCRRRCGPSSGFPCCAPEFWRQSRC